jgi:hypothetical protein
LLVHYRQIDAFMDRWLIGANGLLEPRRSLTHDPSGLYAAGGMRRLRARADS